MPVAPVMVRPLKVATPLVIDAVAPALMVPVPDAILAVTVPVAVGDDGARAVFDRDDRLGVRGWPLVGGGARLGRYDELAGDSRRPRGHRFRHEASQ